MILLALLAMIESYWNVWGYNNHDLRLKTIHSLVNMPCACGTPPLSGW